VKSKISILFISLTVHIRPRNSIINESEDFPIKLISYKELIKAKKASNRHRDINDIAHLEEE